MSHMMVERCNKYLKEKDKMLLNILQKSFKLGSFTPSLRGDGTLKYGDVHEKFNFLEIQELRTLRACQNHFETILPNFIQDECEI